MSDENVEVVRRGFAHFEATGEPLEEIYAPGFVWDMSTFRALVGISERYEGTEGMRRFIEEWTEPFSDWQIEVESMHDAGEKVVVVCLQTGRSKASGIPVEMRLAQVFTVRDGLQTRMEMYDDPADAFTAAGLPPEPTSRDAEELIRWGYAWFNREHEPPPTWLPDGEFVNSAHDPDHATYRGIEAIRRQHAGWFESYPDLRVEPLEIRANGERVFVWVRFTGHGAGSGLTMEMELAHVVTLADGKTKRVEEYLDRAEGLRAVGLAD